IDSTASKHKLANELNFTQEGKNNLEIKSVLMKRTACFGTCQVYKVKFKLDGTAIYNGIRYVVKKGKYKGKFGSYNYGKLISFINKIECEDFNKEYRVKTTDLPGVAIIITYKSGSEKKVYSYGSGAPIGFWALTKVIDAIRNEIDWHKID